MNYERMRDADFAKKLLEHVAARYLDTSILVAAQERYAAAVFALADAEGLVEDEEEF